MTNENLFKMMGFSYYESTTCSGIWVYRGNFEFYLNEYQSETEELLYENALRVIFDRIFIEII